MRRNGTEAAKHLLALRRTALAAAESAAAEIHARLDQTSTTALALALYEGRAQERTRARRLYYMALIRVYRCR